MQEPTIERDRSGQPHAGKVFAAVHAHLSDIPYFAGGLCAKLIAEGYTGYLIRTTNDETSGGQSSAQNILSNETEHGAMAEPDGDRVGRVGADDERLRPEVPRPAGRHQRRIVVGAVTDRHRPGADAA